MGKHRPPVADGERDGARAALFIGLIGVLAVGCVFGIWALLSPGVTPARSDSSGLSSVRLQAEPTDTAAALPSPSESFVVPVPTFVTPTLAVALGTLEPIIPGDVPIAPGSLPTTTTPKPPPAPPPAVSVRNLALECQLQGRRVRATLSFQSTGAVPVTLSAGTRTESTTASGDVKLTLQGDASTRGGSSCSASVNGQQVGPVPAR